MCGGGIVGDIVHPLVDVGLAAVSGPFAPLTVGGLHTAEGLVDGQGLGKSLRSGLKAGGLTFAGQEILGAAANQFPETFGALGVTDTGGNSLTDLLGKTSGAGSFTGAGTMGGAIKDLFSGGGASSASTPSSAVTSAAGKTGAASAAPSVAAPSATASPIGGSSATDWFDKFDPTIRSNISAPGGASPGTQGIGGTASYDLNGAINGGSPSLASTANAASPNLLEKAQSAFTSPSALLAGGGLAMNAIKGNQPLAGETALKEQASKLSQQGDKLGSYLESGTLPPGLQQGLNQATNAAKATIRSKYASMGMSGSSSEQQELQAVDERAQAQGSQMALQLLQTGISETGMSSGLYEALMKGSLEQDQSLGSAISAFASAAGGGTGGGGVTVNYGHG